MGPCAGRGQSGTEELSSNNRAAAQQTRNAGESIDTNVFVACVRRRWIRKKRYTIAHSLHGCSAYVVTNGSRLIPHSSVFVRLHALCIDVTSAIRWAECGGANQEKTFEF